MSRSYAREVVLKTIFQMDFHEGEQKELYLQYIERFELPERELEYAKEMITQIFIQKEKLDHMINSYLVNWDIKRLNMMDLAILRLATYEIVSKRDIPPPVSINEAINFTLKYSEEESIKYINAVLEKIANVERDFD